MALTESTMLPLGTQAPQFELPDAVSGIDISLEAMRSDVATVIVFMCNHCPYVIHILPELLNVAREYQYKGINFIAISANDIKEHPADAPDKMKSLAGENNFPFPYLFDETQEVAKIYKAACTPDFFVFDGDLKCVYRGRFDGSSPGNAEPLTGEDIRHALDAILAGKAVDSEQSPSIGCNIKWKNDSSSA